MVYCEITEEDIMMIKVSDEERKKIQLSILKEIKNICEKENITYYLAYGTLLGAVRHKGFIPWDDDIDIMMPRKDYDRFIHLTKNNAFEVISIETNNKYIYSFAKAVDYNTKLVVEGIRCSLQMGVYVDIFPIDNVGNSYKEGKQFFKSNSILFGLSVASNWNKYIKGRTDNKKRNLLRFLSFCLSRVVPQVWIHEKYNKSISRRKKLKDKYVAVCMSPYGIKEIMPVSVYSNPKQISFEGELFNVPNKYDCYLKKIYGDYMTPPPPEKRVNIHKDVFYHL